ncbi:Gfo/Idh/MocA family oxidoreductase [Rhodococcus sp. BP-349]|uniref:Gfo/Idh/MocA family protein n=1 Tax=unclassified Rhodococcus (in: high G+C Gram-positive bacteria) TaxID=192944 RepID=UPI001C9A9DE8|nr:MULTISPECIES: Gfo/Idh/MocA family oxidoreductase [unclassified Rhodococcus (in: high G+C Gram-positive bacteria)]MBY6540066.1 Gfo/Idh/MocA family oxidoreductase [Rhodococcus sp. BP-363]MBY6543606.1 Gfo/Idh/MocA family oxidoreductase [Rhodococcus sp. BP-369]MBY6562836.1 Gfo/Idh/MocA family oxidoreductase [Rhodococcus sp. BP-370]MBY6577128.1 Gfo/Idh/MocA family oxidoreductase [Rhodococcus sp. BP-364]MBY6586429.1 Gfo/Idh/MocA family oxidoreductase [Rhodococcus sp. BP-358]
MSHPTRTLRIAMNGVTGRMGYRQHLLRSILPIRDAGGLLLADGSRVQVEPVLVGRNEAKLQGLCAQHGIAEYTTDAQSVIDDASIDIYFDAQVTSRRAEALSSAMKAGKHIFTEKPTAETLTQAIELARIGQNAGVTAGVVHDKLYLPGLVKLKRLVDEGFFGRILSLRGEFGYWVFEGDGQPAQRPSWNYRAEDGGGIVVDMFCHWNYVLEGILGKVETVTAKATTHIPTRWDEQGNEYAATADDAAYGIFEMQNGVVAQINSSWAVRVFRDELVEFQVDGTHGSAVAGLRNCVAQHRSHTPKPVWNPDLPVTEPFRDQWLDVPANADLDNGFKLQWEEFLRDVIAERPHRYGLLSAARGVQLAELGLRSSAEGRRLDVPEISL